MTNCLRNLEGWRVLELYTLQLSKQTIQERVGGPLRREPVETKVCCFSFQANFFQDGFEQHPLVRVHPVTGEKTFCINEGFIRRIVGFMKEELNYLLKFLSDCLARRSDLHVRASYEPGTVVIWVGACMICTALLCY